jgi:hypothetical protein
MNWQRSEPVPALCVHPPGVVSLDEAHAAIEQWEHYSHRVLDGAQRLAVEHMMGENGQGRWAARSTGRTVSRQNGKGDELEVVEAWCLTQRGEAIVHTAHEIPTAKSAHARLVGHLESHRDLRRFVRQVRYANGDQQIEMTNGGVIGYRTRTLRGARGLDDISRLVVDEAQHAVPEQLASATPILAANPNPQINFTGSAGISGRSMWWWDMRRRALSGESGEFGWLEHSAERVSLVDGRVVSVKPDVWDRANWAAANPAFPHRIDAGYLEEQLRLLGPDLFAREHLGVWDPDIGVGSGVFGPGVWEAVNSATAPQMVHGVVFSLAINPERSLAAIGVAGAGGSVGLVEQRPGIGWAVDEAIRLGVKYEARVVVCSSGPAGSEIGSIERGGVTVVPLSSAEFRAACNKMYDSVIEGRVVVGRHPALDAAVASATQRHSPDGWVWDRRTGDVVALEAATCALFVATNFVSVAPAFTFLDRFVDDDD